MSLMAVCAGSKLIATCSGKPLVVACSEEIGQCVLAGEYDVCSDKSCGDKGPFVVDLGSIEIFNPSKTPHLYVEVVSDAVSFTDRFFAITQFQFRKRVQDAWVNGFDLPLIDTFGCSKVESNWAGFVTIAGGSGQRQSWLCRYVSERDTRFAAANWGGGTASVACYAMSAIDGKFGRSIGRLIHLLDSDVAWTMPLWVQAAGNPTRRYEVDIEGEATYLRVVSQFGGVVVADGEQGRVDVTGTYTLNIREDKKSEAHRVDIEATGPSCDCVVTDIRRVAA